MFSVLYFLKSGHPSLNYTRGTDACSLYCSSVSDYMWATCCEWL